MLTLGSGYKSELPTLSLPPAPYSPTLHLSASRASPHRLMHIRAPCMGRCAQGCGAALNGQPISVSGTEQMAHALLATEVGVTRDPATFRAVFGRVEALAQVRVRTTTGFVTDKTQTLFFAGDPGSLGMVKASGCDVSVQAGRCRLMQGSADMTRDMLCAGDAVGAVLRVVRAQPVQRGVREGGRIL